MSFDTGLMYFYKAPMQSGVSASIFETNATEIGSDFADVWFVWLPAFSLYCFLAIKASGEILRKTKKIISISVLCLLADIAGVFVLPLFVEKKDFQDIEDDIITSSFIAYYASKIPAKYPFVTGSLFLTGAYFEETAKIKASRENRKELPEGISFQAGLSKNTAKIIVVVGESALREHHSLYGYPAPTTPFLDSLSNVDKRLLSYYEHVISPASYTREVLRMTFSYATPSNVRPFTEYKNLIRLAKDSGYKTGWISAQNESGWYNSIVSLIARTADTCCFHPVDDLDLIPCIKLCIQKGRKQFIVVHINGSHWDYADRFDGEDTKALGDTSSFYDRTIHHTDHVLSEIYRIARSFDENVLLYYYSDHGEVVGEKKYAGHGINYKFKAQYHVPLIIMQNRPFINADSIVNKYYDGLTGRLSTSSNMYILGELMGYQTSDSLIEKSKMDGRYVRQGDGAHILYEDIKD
jgi:heptose-I-phosphate ethanolaminephosphotransferase